MINSTEINSRALNAAADTGLGEDVRETAVITGRHVFARQDVRDTAVLRGQAWAYPYYETVRETAVITGDYAPPFIRGLVVTDTAVVTSRFDILRATQPDVRDAAVVSDATYLHTIRTQDVAETAVVTGDAVETAPGQEIRDAAIITSSATYTLTARYTVRDTATLGDAAYPGGSHDITDTFVGLSTAYPHSISRYTVRETAVVAGAEDFGTAQELTLDVRETAVVAGHATDILHARLDVHEVAFLSDRMVSPDGLVGVDGLPVDSVWTASVASWGMSRHSGTGITQRGVRFAVSPAGLYEIGAGYSTAEIDTGFLGLGTKALKHVPAVYLQGSRDGDMTVTVTADRNGARAVHSYVPVGRAQADSRTIRFDIGRGYRSTYYKLHIQTTGRTELFGGGVLVARTERRI